MRFYIKYILSSLLLAISITLKAQGIAFASGELQQMAKMMALTDTLKMLSEGVSVRKHYYKNIPLTLVKRKGRVVHIGYSLFSEKQREIVGEVRSNFLERFLLSADLPFQREKTIEEEMMEEKIMFRKGNLSTLRGLANGNDHEVEASLLNGKLHAMKWMNGSNVICEVGFPANHELLLGRNLLENDERLQFDVLSMPGETLKGRYDLDETKLQKIQDVYVLKGDTYISKDLTSNRYFVKNIDGSFQPLFSDKAPRESLANLFSACDIEQNYTLEITQKQYNFKQSTFSVPLAKWLDYCNDLGFKSYFSVIKSDKTMIDGLIVFRNEQLGCNHVMRISFDAAAMSPRSGKIAARLNAFVPISNVSDFYYESKLK